MSMAAAERPKRSRYRTPKAPKSHPAELQRNAAMALYSQAQAKSAATERAFECWYRANGATLATVLLTLIAWGFGGPLWLLMLPAFIFALSAVDAAIGVAVALREGRAVQRDIDRRLGE